MTSTPPSTRPARRVAPLAAALGILTTDRRREVDGLLRRELRRASETGRAFARGVRDPSASTETRAAWARVVSKMRGHARAAHALRGALRGRAFGEVFPTATVAGASRRTWSRRGLPRDVADLAVHIGLCSRTPIHPGVSLPAIERAALGWVWDLPADTELPVEVSGPRTDGPDTPPTPAPSRYLFAMLLDTLTPGQRVAQAMHVTAAWVERYGPAPERVLAFVGPVELLLALRSLPTGQLAAFEEPDASCGGPGLTAVAYTSPPPPTGGMDLRGMLRRCPPA